MFSLRMASLTPKTAMLALVFAAAVVKFSVTVGLFVTFATYICTGGYETIYVIMVVLSRDLRFLLKVSSVYREINLIAQKSIAQIFEETAGRFPDKVAFVCADTGKKVTFKECLDLINKIACTFQKKGYTKGDRIALFMENDVEYLPIWIGLSKIGVITALINTNLTGKSLEHSLTVAQFKGVIYSVGLESGLTEINIFETNLDFFVIKNTSISDVHHEKSVDFHQLIESGHALENFIPEDLDARDPVLYIYTSGSTGKPKAALINVKKLHTFLIGFSSLPGYKPEDVVYNCLPLYHTSGNLCFGVPTIYSGCTAVLRKKFSASRLIDDCRSHGVTHVGYIGEMWRYVLSQPPKDGDKNHSIKMAVGNGLRKSLYGQVQSRFGIKDIREFYGATEGNVGFMNLDNKEGAVGALLKAFPFLNGSNLVKCDIETGELIRSETGLGIKCGPGEPGMMVGKILENRQRYDGYVNNEKETQKKVAENVFKKGDKVFLTGDILEQDEFGYLYFVDRIGDTFRWKSENVSTTEVENVISSITSADVVVYPVSVPGHEGKAGMAYLLESDSAKFVIDSFAQTLRKHLPKYAIPMFLRVGKSVKKTGTFKYQKFTLKQQAYDLELCDPDEKLYVYDVKMNAYRVLDKNVQEDIKEMKMRF